MGRDDLAVLRHGPRGASEADREIIEAGRRSSAQLVIMRAGSDRGDRFGFSPDLSEADATELAYWMLKGQLHVYRALISAGVCLFVHCEFSPEDTAAFRRGSEVLCSEIEESVSADAERTQTDLWILRNLNFFFGVRLENLVRNILRETLPMMEARMRRVREAVRRASDSTAVPAFHPE